jgi:hypothetical protein
MATSAIFFSKSVLKILAKVSVMSVVIKGFTSKQILESVLSTCLLNLPHWP